MGNSIFSRGTKPAPDLKAGLHRGTIEKIETRYNSDGEAFHIFHGFVMFAGARHNVSAAASDDTKKTRKLVRWMLALNGQTPEDVPDDIDLSQLPDRGQALFMVSYERSKRDETTGKYVKVRTEFPQLDDVLPLPLNGDADQVPF